MNLAASGVTQSRHTEEVLQIIAFQLPSLLLVLGVCLSEILNTQNCKDVRMSVDAGGGKLKSFQVTKGHQKSKQTSTLKKLKKNFRKCRDDSLVKKVWGQG